MNVQMWGVMPLDEGVYVLRGHDLHEGTGRQRLERTDSFRLVGPKIREAEDVPFGFDKKPTEVDAIRARPSDHGSPPAASRRGSVRQRFLLGQEPWPAA